MAELKTVVINLKSLDQDIQDPILAGGGDANSRSLKIIFTQEAQAQLTPETKVYLKWHHQELDIDGYNIFTKCIDSTHRYNIWEIKWPLAMLHEGNVTCCVELVDKVSIGQTVSFIVHVIADPHDGSHYIVTDDFTEFQQACIAIATLTETVSTQFDSWKVQFADMAKIVNQMDAKINAVDAKVLPTNIEDPTQDQVLKYDTSTGKWHNKDESGGGGGGSVSWGNISGTLSNQTDLQAVLNRKVDSEDAVHISGNETIQGIKTFANPPRTSYLPTESEDISNKLYVDAQTATKQDKLPTAINDYYLHVNATTGALEWAPSGGSSAFTVLTNAEITTIWDEAGV